MRAVNLLPRDVERARSEGGRAPLLVAAGGIAAVTAVMVVLFVSASGSIDDQRAQLDSVEAAIARVGDTGQPAVAPGAIAQERTDRVAALSAALTTRVPLDRLLRELAFVLPEDAWLTGLSAAAPAGAATARPRRRPLRRRESRSRARRTRTSRSRVCSPVSRRSPRSTTFDSPRAHASIPRQSGRRRRRRRRSDGKTVVTFSVAANLRPGAGREGAASPRFRPAR